MATSAHRRLSLQQLATLAHVYWDDRAELAKVVEDLRSHNEREAEDLRQSTVDRLAELADAKDKRKRPSPMVSRKLNLKQLVTLSEVYWDDAAKLNEILEALRSRLEPDADVLFRSIARRLDTLKNDPKPAGGSTPRSDADELSASSEAAETDGASPRRRRWPVAVIFGVILAAVAAWFWWPPDDAAQTVAETEQGPEIQENNELPAAPAPSGISLPAPPVTTARRATVEPPPAEARDAGERTRSRVPNASRSPDVKEPREATPRQAEAGSGGSSASAAGGSRVRSGEVASAAASSSSRGPGLRGPAARGVAIPEAQLDCYLTDNRPSSCGVPPSGGGGSASGDAGRAVPRAGEPGSPSPPPEATTAASAPPVAATSAGGAPASRAATRSEQIAASASAGNSSSNRGAGGASSGGGTAGSSETSAVASSIRRAPSRAASSGGAADTQAGGAAGAPPPQAAPSQKLPPAACPPVSESGRVVFILDGSVSMALPLDVDAALEDELDRRILRKDAAARQQYRELLAEPGPKRITRAQDAFAEAAGDLPPTVELGLLVFQECRDIRRIGIFDATRRGSAVEYVRNLVPRGRTPLAESLRNAGGMLGEGRSSVVLLTDGREFCGGDPCAAAAEFKAEHPGTPVHVVDITGQAKAECIADLTGGRSYKPEATEDLARILRNAFRGADAQCGAPAVEPAAR
jgi:Mg-chelatase subunit ChlD